MPLPDHAPVGFNELNIQSCSAAANLLAPAISSPRVRPNVRFCSHCRHLAALPRTAALGDERTHALQHPGVAELQHLQETCCRLVRFRSMLARSK